MVACRSPFIFLESATQSMDDYPRQFSSSLRAIAEPSRQRHYQKSIRKWSKIFLPNSFRPLCVNLGRLQLLAQASDRKFSLDFEFFSCNCSLLYVLTRFSSYTTGFSIQLRSFVRTIDLEFVQHEYNLVEIYESQCCDIAEPIPTEVQAYEICMSRPIIFAFCSHLIRQNFRTTAESCNLSEMFDRL